MCIRRQLIENSIRTRHVSNHSSSYKSLGNKSGQPGTRLARLDRAFVIVLAVLLLLANRAQGTGPASLADSSYLATQDLDEAAILRQLAELAAGIEQHPARINDFEMTIERIWGRAFGTNPAALHPRQRGSVHRWSR